MDTISITVHRNTVTRDMGDATTTPSDLTVADVLFAPRSSSEASDSRSPKIITAASLYRRGTGLVLDADDTVTIAGVSAMVDGTWQVEGIPGMWGTSGVEVAIKRTSVV